MSVVILGDGLLGSEIQRKTNWVFLSRKKDSIDIRNLDSWLHLMDAYDTIVNCIALTETYQNRKKNYWDINFRPVIQLANYCNQKDKKLVQISTDYVYANSIGIPNEEDIPVHQATDYAHTKLLADGYIEAVSKRYLITRGTHKPKPFPYPRAWKNQSGNFDYVDVIADKIIQLVKKKAEGIFNVGTSTKTMYKLAQKTYKDVVAIDRPNDLIPENVQMDTSKMNTFLDKY